MLQTLRSYVVFAILLLAAGSALANKPVVLDGTFGTSLGSTQLPIPDQTGHAWVQQSRADSIASSDSRFDGATLTIFEQLDTFTSNGTFRIYSEIKTTNPDDRLYAYYEGSYTIGTGTVPFSARGKIISGTGVFAGAAGTVQVNGDAAAGKYTVRLVLTK